MKLSQNLRTTVSDKVPKLIGLSSSRHENYDSQYNWNYGSTKNTQKYDFYTPSSSSKSKICPYQNPMIYSQASDRIYQFQNVLFNNPLKNSSQNIKINMEDSLKQHELRNQKSLSDIQQKEAIREQILQQVYRILHQHRAQSAKSLREAVFKIDQSIKRECITQFNRQFISLSFLDQTDKRFNEVENVIKDQKSLMIQMQDMLKQKEYQKVIGNTQKLSLEIQELKQEIRNVRLNFDMELNKRQYKISFIEDRCVNMERLYQEISAVSTSLEQVKKLKEMLKWSNEKEITNKINQIQKSLQEIKNQNKKQLKVSQIKEQQPIEINRKPLENDQIEQRRTIENDKLFQMLHISQNHFKSGLSLSYSFESLDGSLNPNQKRMKKQKSIVNSLKDIKSTKYILDICNQLMDESGNYILDEQGNQIKLSQDQILILKESNIVKYKEP